MKHILLLEDDPGFGYILSEYLNMQQFKVTWVQTGENALKYLRKAPYDLVILDIMLPQLNGFDVASIIAQEYEDLPFIFLSAKSLKIDKLKGFKLGAYDYITKPIDEELLVAKINAILKQGQKSKANQPEIFRLGSYVFYPKTFQLQHTTGNIKLTSTEAKLLSLLCHHANDLLARKKALQKIWGSSDEFSRKSMDVFISKLRKYLDKDPGIQIENIHGQGFILHIPI